MIFQSPHLKVNTIPQFSEADVRERLSAINPKESVPSEDIPPKMVNKFAAELAKLLTI